MSQFTRFFVWIKKRKQIFANMACGDKMTNIKERHVQKNFYFRALPKLPPPLTLRKYLVLSRVSPRSPVNIPLPSHPVFVTYSPYSPFPLHFLILLPFSQLVQACPVNIPPHPVFVTYSLSHILSHILPVNILLPSHPVLSHILSLMPETYFLPFLLKIHLSGVELIIHLMLMMRMKREVLSKRETFSGTLAQCEISP